MEEIKPEERSKPLFPRISLLFYHLSSSSCLPPLPSPSHLISISASMKGMKSCILFSEITCNQINLPISSLLLSYPPFRVCFASVLKCPPVCRIKKEQKNSLLASFRGHYSTRNGIWRQKCLMSVSLSDRRRRCLVPCQGINLHPPIKLIGKREKKEKEAAIPRLREGFSLAPSTSSMYSKFGDNVEVEMSEFWESV